MRNLRLWRVAWVALVLAAAPATAVASPTTFTLGPAINASATNPFASCSLGSDRNANPPSVNYLDTEVEPFVAVNPTNHANIIGVYQQDRWTDGGSKGLVASRSFDGGATWAQNFGEFSKCSEILSTAYTSPSRGRPTRG